MNETLREKEKQRAAQAALSYIRSGMIIGLGTGTTTRYFVEYLAAALRRGDLHDIIGIPTSRRTAHLAHTLGIPLATLDTYSYVDVAIDGADEVDPQLNLIKGRGRALVREKIVEIHAREFIVIVDASKLVYRLGTHGPLPVEVVPFGAAATARWLATLGCQPEFVREANRALFRSDNGNYQILCHFEAGIQDPYTLAHTLKSRPGVVDHGLFLDLAHKVIVGEPTGVRVLERTP